MKLNKDLIGKTINCKNMSNDMEGIIIGLNKDNYAVKWFRNFDELSVWEGTISSHLVNEYLK